MAATREACFDQSGYGWLSHGFEELVREVTESDSKEVHFDVLIVGSGYGGAMAAMTFAGRKKPDGKEKLRVGVLERGNEYIPGQFPATPSELPGYIRIDRHKEGLFDVRLGPEVNTLVANGLGGGSLINAGVMAIPSCSVFGQRWPSDLSNGTALNRHYALARALLGASRKEPGKAGTTQENTISVFARSKDGFVPEKHKRLRELAAERNLPFEPAAVTVALDDDTVNSAGVRLSKCVACGDCATGCNFGAKDSLDTNLLVQAHRAGAEIYTGATVLRVEQDDCGWIVNAVYTRSKLRARHEGLVRIRARKIVIAAGTLGSTEILLRSRSDRLKFSNLLGHRCSTNGDTIITDYAGKKTVNAIADEADAPSSRGIGPTITGIVDLRQTKFDPNDKRPAGLVIEEMAVPSSMRRVFAEIFGSANTLHGLIERDRDKHEQCLPDDDIYAIGKDRLKKTALYAVMGNDTAAGRIELRKYSGDDHDGTGHIRWPGLPQQGLFDCQVAAVTSLTSASGGRVIPNPGWKLLPSEIDTLMDGERGPVLTVHPLGGCPMADDPTSGVVDQYGRVFRRRRLPDDDPADPSPVYEGLVVLDGSIIPTALGINPALTIAAIALRASRHLAQEWHYRQDFSHSESAEKGIKSTRKSLASVDDGRKPAMAERPAFRASDALDKPSEPEPTEVRITERLSGRVRLENANGASKFYAVDLTLRFEPKKLSDLQTPGIKPVVEVDTQAKDPFTDSRMRILDLEDWEKLKSRSLTKSALEKALDKAAVFSAPLSGSLTMFERECSGPRWRMSRGLWAWLRNRGCRDVFQAWRDRSKGQGILSRLRARRESWLSFRRWLGRVRRWTRDTMSIASHAGEVRLEEYELEVGADEAGEGFVPRGTMRIHALKQFTYNRRGNPWRQLMCVKLLEYPGRPSGFDRWFGALRSKRDGPILELDMDFLANIDTPLYQVTKQDNAVHAIAEFGSYIAWFMRMLAGIHLWTFRLPDRATRIEPQQLLPARPPGLPAPEIKELYVGQYAPHYEDSAEPIPVFVRLTRYARPDSDKPPLVMLHGYSASGTTYAHHSLDPSFASYFYDARRDRDIWIVDLRTSAGMPTAKRGWSFEQVAFCDIPAALCYVNQQTEKQLDIISHCMGAAMFSMAVLDDEASEVGLEYLNERRKLSGLINKAVLSQIGPLIVFSPANRLRALLARFLTEFLPDSYTFNPGPNASLGQQLLDRALSSVPYPTKEFDVENPRPWFFWKRTPWTRTRHRMDALYGRAFNVDEIDASVLGYIDDFFGPMSIKTVSQTIHFANLGRITNRRGRNTFVSRTNLKKYWRFPTLGIHGSENGLSSVATQDRIRRILGDVKRNFTTKTIEGAGHQDCLIGKKRKRVLKTIEAFLDGRLPSDSETKKSKDKKSPPDEEERTVAVPWIGPLVTQHFTDPGRTPTSSVDRDLVTLRVGATPYHKEPACVVLLPVMLADGMIRDRSGEPFTEAEINEKMWIYRSTTFSRDGWDAFIAPPALTSGDLLVLVIYAESKKLAGLGRQIDDKGAVDVSGVDQSDKSATHRPCHEYFCRIDGADTNVCIEVGHWDTPSGPGIAQANWNEAVEEILKRLEEQVDGEETFANRIAIRDSSLTHGVVTFRPQKAQSKPREFGFALGSCQYQTSFLDGEPGFASYRRLLEQIASGASGGADVQGADLGICESPVKPECVVLTGDQIYVDATAGLLDPTVKDDDRYDKPYVRWLRNHSVRDVLRQLPSFMMLDDHEIEDNWEPLRNRKAPVVKNMDKLEAGRKAYLKYQFGRLHDDVYAKLGCAGLTPLKHAEDGLSYAFRFAGHPFFMLDTRTQREHRWVGTIKEARMYAQRDWEKLSKWLLATKKIDGPKFIVSPAMILPHHRTTTRWNHPMSALASDGWDGFPAAMSELLGFIADNDIRQVVFLSGDEHLPCLANIEISSSAGNRVKAHSIHTSPTYAPFTFANSRKEDFAPNSVPYVFERCSVKYTCDVVARFPEIGDGFTLIRAFTERDTWHLDVRFPDGEKYDCVLDRSTRPTALV